MRRLQRSKEDYISVFNRVCGVTADNEPLEGRPVHVGGKAVDTATHAPAYAAGNAASHAIDKDTGTLLVKTVGLAPL